ncbi:MAG TPA: EAL domain-containing protein, partial [Burkholderiaceae bacterium]
MEPRPPLTDALAKPDVNTEAELRSRRFVQIAGFSVVGLAIRIFTSLYNQEWLVAWVLLMGLIAVLASLILNKRQQRHANPLLLTSLALMIAFLAWISEGIYDSALFAFPCLLIMAGLLLRRRQFFAFSAMTVVAVLFVAYAGISGWHVFKPIGDPVNRVIDTVLMLTVSGMAVWVMTRDLHHALRRLREEVERVHESRASLAYLAQHDVLTGLPNRLLGRELLEQTIVQARRRNRRIALLFVDLDHFKQVNDTLGHSAGDEFLREVAHRLSRAVRASDIVARQGGDEFLIGLTDVDDIEAVSAAAGHILGAMTKPFSVRDVPISSSCSIGIAIFPDDAQDFETLLRLSDIGMYQAKESGRNMVRFYDEAMNSNIVQNLQLTSSLRLALTRGEFILHYQPVVDMATGRMVGAEALIRWQHPQEGMVAPGQFIPAAERSGLIVEIGEWVITEACQQMRVWQDMGAPDFVLAINLSPVQFRRGNIEGIVAKALELSGLNPACLELELTESTLIQNPEEFIESLRKLKALGVRLSIDDFGTGYSNLAYLQRFEVDKIKIDQSFVRRLDESKPDLAIVNAIIQMAKSLNLSTTAEGIETESIRRKLIELGCDQGQGYLFAKPQSAPQF